VGKKLSPFWGIIIDNNKLDSQLNKYQEVTIGQDEIIIEISKNKV
jgi:hypothetical protein